MKAAYIPYLLILGMVINCNTVKNISKSQPAEKYNEIVAYSKEKKARILFSDGQREKARIISFENDSIQWIGAKSGEMQSQSIDKIQRIIFVKRFKGRFEGYWYGFLLGIPAGLLSGLPYNDDPDGFLGAGASAGEKAFYRSMAGGGIGALAGGLIGLVRGHRVIYNFDAGRGKDSEK